MYVICFVVFVGFFQISELAPLRRIHRLMQIPSFEVCHSPIENKVVWSVDAGHKKSFAYSCQCGNIFYLICLDS